MKDLRNYINEARRLKDPEIGRIAFDMGRQKWEIEDIWFPGNDRDELDWIIDKYDESGVMADEMENGYFDEEKDIIVGASSGSEKAAWIWGPGGLYYK